MIKEDILDTNDNELIMLYREDDEDAKNILFYKYRFIIDILIKKYSHLIGILKIDFQEVYSECTVGFSDALRSYREDKHTSLSTFITLCIERKIGNLLRKYSRDKYKGIQDTYSLDFFYEDKATKLMDIISDECDNDPLRNITEEENCKEFVDDVKGVLTKVEFEVFALKIKGLNYIEIAKILNKEPKQIDNAIQRIKNKIKNLLSEKE